MKSGRRHCQQRFSRGGVVLVAVLWICVILTLVAVTISRRGHFDWKISAAECEKIRCRWAVRAGIEKAIAILTADDNEADWPGDVWGTQLDDNRTIELEGCTVEFEIFDEAARLNVNNATAAQLEALDCVDETIAQSIVDWIDKDNDARQVGAENDYYLDREIPHPARNAPIKTIGELGLIKDVTPGLLYGSSGAMAVDVEVEAEQAQTEIRTVGLCDVLTCYSRDDQENAEGTAQIDINSTDEQTLESDLGISKGQARWIVERRGNGYISTADLLDHSRKAQGGDGDKQGNKNSDSDSGSQQGRGKGNDENNDNSSGNDSGNDQKVAAEPINRELYIEISDKIVAGAKGGKDGKDEKGGSGGSIGRVNVNTADEEVFTALFEDNSDLASALVNFRDSRSEPISGIGQVLECSDITVDGFRKIAPYLTTRSNIFRIKCTATSAGTGLVFCSEVVVDRSKSPAAILYSCDTQGQ